MDYDPARMIGLALPVRGRGRWLLCSKLLGSAFGNILGSCFGLLFWYPVRAGVPLVMTTACTMM
jgi:hypothetical protein